jgi:cleavage and polyadenylation specificity factor subunit 3
MEGFRGRIFATHPTVAVMRMLLEDYVRLGRLDAPGVRQNYSEEQLRACVDRIEPLDFRTTAMVDGVSIRLVPAGHVLGAAMTQLELDNIRILYTGDYSFEIDRHLPQATPPADYGPDVLICESTFGVDRTIPRAEREQLLLRTVQGIVSGRGKVLMPVFSFGRAQELLLILEEHWRAHPELHSVPLYFLSAFSNSDGPETRASAFI